jgi:hypothetical protein
MTKVLHYKYMSARVFKIFSTLIYNSTVGAVNISHVAEYPEFVSCLT